MTPILVVTIIMLLLASCTAAQPEGVDARDLDPFAEEAICAWHIGAPDHGRYLFELPVLAGAGGCVTCHSREPDVTLVGPSLHDMSITANTRQDGVLPSNYIYFSIVRPNQFVVDGFQPDIMPHNYESELTEEEITDLVAYLMTLGDTEGPQFGASE